MRWFYVLSSILVLFFIVVGLTVLTLIIKKPKFIDLQIFIMVIALSMSCDMIFCKQLNLYYYVVVAFKGWYSFWGDFIIVPAFGLIFIKFLPVKKWAVAVYIVSWSICDTLFEEYLTKPLGIILYPKWQVVPYTFIGTMIAFILVYV